MAKKSLYAKGMFMIFLILALPFYISDAYAQNQLEVTRHSGDANVNGFFDSYDRWILEATARVENDQQITKNQVKVNNVSMQNCSVIDQATNTYKCTYASAYYSLTGGSYNSTVQLFGDNNALLQSKPITMTMDKLGPAVFFDRLPLQNGSIVSVAYTVKDQAWQEDVFSVCSGLDKIEFWDNTVKLAEQNITSDDCEYSGVNIIPLPATGNLIIRAYDKMGHITSEPSPAFELDSAAPQIQTGTFKIITQNIELQQFIPSGLFPAVIEVKILENKGLQPQNVVADLSLFGADSSVRAAACQKFGNEYTCRWPAVQLTIPTGTYNIKITAADDVGNKHEVVAVKSFTVDTTAPNIIFFGTRTAWNSMSYIGEVPIDIVAVVSDTGAGLGARQALIDLSEIDPSYQGRYFQPNKCEKIGANWECVWGPVLSKKKHESRGNVFILKMFDDAGNQAVGSMQAPVFIDRKAPDVQKLSEEEARETTGYEAGGTYYAMINSVGELPTPVVSSGDDIIVSVRVKDDSEIKAVADFSRIMGQSGYEETPAECITEDNENWNCIWEIGPVSSGYLKEKVFFTFTDSAGNNETVDQKVEVYAKSFEEEPDYWRAYSFDTMPNYLDRSTTELINHKMYFHIKMSSSTAARLATAELAECTGDTSYVDDVFIFNNERGKTDIFIGMSFKKFKAQVDSLTITCVLNLLSTYNKKLTTKFEKEPVALTVQFYDAPLGEASLSLRKEIQDEIDDWYGHGFWETIQVLNDIFAICEVLCRVYYTIRQLITFFDLIKELFTVVEKTPAAPVAAPARLGMCLKEERTKEALDKPDGWAKFFDKFCGFINCKYGLSGVQPDQLNEFFSGGYWGPSFKQAVSTSQGAEDYRRGISTGGYMNVKDSWILSLVTLCIPGIIYNLQKIRAIHCEYIGCMLRAVQMGVSIDMCESVKSYQECKYIIGPLFALVPWLEFWSYMTQLVRQAISDPLAALGAGIAAGCYLYCPEPGGAGHRACIFVKILAELGDIITNIEQIIKPETWKLERDSCHAIEDDVEDFEAGTPISPEEKIEG
jgi:hypothetical protein